MESSIGKTTQTCISMAIADFYRSHENYTTVIEPHFRDSKQDNVEAASASIDLLKNVQVTAIFGPLMSSQADFVIEIGNKSKVPIISPATSPSLSPNDNAYFVRTAHCSSSQLAPLVDLIKHFGWREIVFVYEDDEYGRGLVPYLSESMSKIDTKVVSRVSIYPSGSNDWILEKLYRLKTMQTRVFLVHMLPALASRFFAKVKEVGMMEDGFVWIVTEVLTSRLHSLDRMDIDSMQGVIGLKSYIPRSEYVGFEKRWRREFRKRDSETEVVELDMFGMWAYDAVFALAMALEKVGNETNARFEKGPKSITDLDVIGTSEFGPKLLPWIRNVRFNGVSGDFNVVNGQLQSSVYQIVNIIGKGEKNIGYWSPENGLSKKLKSNVTKTNNENKDNDVLGAIIWPGDSHVIPRGWDIPTSDENKLRVGVPAKGGFVEFVDATTDPKTQKVSVTGFCVDVFYAVIDSLPYYIKPEFMPFDTENAGSYNDLVHSLYLGNYDAVVGDITILANRSEYVDFTLPYTETGVSVIVPRRDERKSAWIFMKPLKKELWITIAGFFIYTGLVVWILEHRVNEEFRGSPHKQVGMIFWFSFSTLVFAHREKLISNLSRFVVIVWVFVVLVLTSSYTASLTSMLTVQQLRPTYTDIMEIRNKGESVGYQDGSFVLGMLQRMNFDDSKLKSYSTVEEYHEALQKGSQNGGVSAIMDELPYIRLLLAKYCSVYTMIGPTYKTAGFGFAFPKGSPLLHDLSRAVLQVTEDQMANISKHWFGESASCDQQPASGVTSDRLSLDSFKGLFLIAGSSSTSALVLFFLTFLYRNKEMIVSQDSISQKLAAIAKTFDVYKDVGSKKTAVSEVQQEAVFEHDDGFSTTEPGTPVHDTIQVVETAIEIGH